MRAWSGILTLVAVLVAGVPPPAWGQQPARAPGEEFRIRVKVELVTTPVTVFDRRGEFVYGLMREDFEVWDNNIPQRISQFEFSSPPISLALLVNTSSRIKPLLARVRATGILFHSYILGETGEAAVITFDDEVRVRQRFTDEPEKIEQAIKAIQAGGDRSRLADALASGIRLLLRRPPERRKVIIIISEPRDAGSETSLGEMLRVAQLADISIYTLALSYTQALLKAKREDRPLPASPFPPGVFPGPPLPGTAQTPTSEQQNVARADLLTVIRQLVAAVHTRVPFEENVLEVLAAATGGAYDSPLSDASLQAAINSIGQELHNQYLLAYRPTNLDQPGYHEIRVRVRRQQIWVRARPGYYLGPPL
ncbi:MAG: VWA domain-containing protein [Terriglobia bacterium]